MAHPDSMVSREKVEEILRDMEKEEVNLMQKLIDTLTKAAQLIDDLEIRTGKVGEYGREVRKEISECLAELYSHRDFPKEMAEIWK